MGETFVTRAWAGRERREEHRVVEPVTSKGASVRPRAWVGVQAADNPRALVGTGRGLPWPPFGKFDVRDQTIVDGTSQGVWQAVSWRERWAAHKV